MDHLNYLADITFEMTKSKHWLLGALRARNNAVVLKDSASDLIKSKNKHHGLFLLMTANEELEKAIWCLLVYYDLVNSNQIITVFKQHEHKIFLFHFIYNYLEFKNGEIYLKSLPLKKFNIKKYAQKQKTYVCNYKNMRENCLYVHDSTLGWSIPKENFLGMKHFDQIIQRQLDIFMGLLQFLHIIGDYDLLNSGASNFKFFPKRNKKIDKGYSFSMGTIAKAKDRKKKLSEIPFNQNFL